MATEAGRSGAPGSEADVYPGYVERALVAIRSQFPKADPRVLCDYIEVTDPRWQMAIEGYLGGARFNIIVDGEYEADAIRLVRPSSDATTACASFKVRRRCAMPLASSQSQTQSFTC